MIIIIVIFICLLIFVLLMGGIGFEYKSSTNNTVNDKLDKIIELLEGKNDEDTTNN